MKVNEKIEFDIETGPINFVGMESIWYEDYYFQLF